MPSCSGIGDGNTTDYTFQTDVCQVKHIPTIRVINCLAQLQAHLTLTAVKLLSRAISMGPKIGFAMCYLISRTLYCIHTTKLMNVLGVISNLLDVDEL